MNQNLIEKLKLKQFPKTSKYDVYWMNDNEMGPNSLWLTEFLSEGLNIQQGMRILDLGCGKAMSSIFLAKEFNTQVWAADLWINANENWKRIKEQQVDNIVFPINCEAHSLPFSNDFFDIIVSIDSYHYFGTNEMYLSYLTKFLKPNGQIGICVPGVNREFTKEDRLKLDKYWEPYNYTHHTSKWWKDIWEKSDTVQVITADEMPNGNKNWLLWDKTLKEAGILKRNGDVEMLELDGGNFTLVRVIANKTSN